MMAAKFDTLTYSKRLELVGFTREQAEGQALAVAELIDRELVTKHDMRSLKKEMLTEMHLIEERLTHKLTVRFGGMLIAGVSVLAVLIKIL